MSYKLPSSHLVGFEKGSPRLPHGDTLEAASSIALVGWAEL